MRIKYVVCVHVSYCIPNRFLFPQDYSDIPDEIFVDANEPDVDENQIEFLSDDDDDSDETEEMFGDSISIKSNQRPKLR